MNDEYTQDMYIYKDLLVIAKKTVQRGDVCMNNEAFEVSESTVGDSKRKPQRLVIQRKKVYSKPPLFL